MATVKDLLRISQGIAAKTTQHVFSDDQIPLLNEAKYQVWLELVSRQFRENWFLVKSQATNQSGDDYFGGFTQTERDYLLPNNFHQLRQIVPTGPTQQQHRIWFYNEKLESQVFQSRLRDTDNQYSIMGYEIIGPEPGTLSLSGLLPQDTPAQLWYVHQPPEWTVASDTIGFMPRGTRLLMARYAVALFQGGAGSIHWDRFIRSWNAEIERWVMDVRRDNSDPQASADFIEQS